MSEEQTELSIDYTDTKNTINHLKWKNIPTINDLKQNITDAKPDCDLHKANVDRWLDNMHLTGSARIKKIPGRSSVQPKLIRKQAEWRYTSLTEPFLNTPDIFNIYPTSAGDVKRAEQNQLVLNNQINTKLDKVTFIDTYVREAVDTGSVFVKVGWVTEEIEKEVDEPIYEYTVDDTGSVAQQYIQLLQIIQQDPESFYDYATPGLTKALEAFTQTGIAYIPNQVSVKRVKKVVEVVNQPTWTVIDQRNIIIDPTCDGEFDKASFIGECFKSCLSNLKKDGKYTNLDAINISGNSPLSDPDYTNSDDATNSSFTFKDKSRDQFVVHEYWGKWDINNTGIVVPIVAAWVGDTLIRLEENPFPDNKPPFVSAVYMPVRKSVYGEPDGELLLDNQKVVGAISRGMIDLMGRSANSQTGTRKDFLDAVNKRRFNRGEDYDFNGNIDPRQGIYQHTYPEIPQSAYNMLTIQNAEAESMSGVKAFSNGINGAAIGLNVGNGKSALDAASMREIGILRRLSAGIIKIGRKFIAMNAEFLSEEEVVRVTAKEFITIRRDDLAGNFDLQLAISTAEEDNQKAQELAFMLQTNGPNSDPAESRMIRAEIARLRKMPALAKKIEEYQPQPDPIALKKAELEIVLLEAQIAKERALESKHLAEAELSGSKGYREVTQGDLNHAKIGTESSKTRDLHSTANKRDLDSKEQEMGVKQERDLQQIHRKVETSAAADIIKNNAMKQGLNAPKI